MGIVLNTLLLIIAVVLRPALSISSDHPKPDGLDEWARNASNQTEKLTHLHFYFHESKPPAKNISAYPVARSPITGTNPYLFGLINMIDDPLTQGPDPRSKAVGRAYGIYALTSMHEFTMFSMLGFLFTEGEYEGSSVSLLSYNPFKHPDRELAIVGGTGAFRLARGVARARTVDESVSAGEATIQYDFYIVHY